MRTSKSALQSKRSQDKSRCTDQLLKQKTKETTKRSDMMMSSAKVQLSRRFTLKLLSRSLRKLLMDTMGLCLLTGKLAAVRHIQWWAVSPMAI